MKMTTKKEYTEAEIKAKIHTLQFRIDKLNDELMNWKMKRPKGES